MLRLSPSMLSLALGRQLIADGGHLRYIFEQQLAPLISSRLLDMSLQRSSSGSIGLGGALTLFLAAYKRAPSLIAEVGTYIGNSAASMALGSGLTGNSFQLITCDLNPCTEQPLDGLALPKGSCARVLKGSSTQMFHALVVQKLKPDLLHLDGRLLQDDLMLLGQLLKDDTVIALDDCEGDEKGHMNLDLLRRSGLLKNHVFVEPFSREVFRGWGIETRSVTGLLLPINLISYARQ